MIKLEGITKSFGELQVLKGIDLEINKGEVISIVGPSGAGKTTLLQIMGTLDQPDTGRIFLNTVARSAHSPRRSSRTTVATISGSSSSFISYCRNLPHWRTL